MDQPQVIHRVRTGNSKYGINRLWRDSLARATVPELIAMSFTKRLLVRVVSLLILLGGSASCSSDQTGPGVAQIDESQMAEIEISTESADTSNPGADTPTPSTSDSGASDKKTDSSELTDEEITTKFTTCIRDHEFNIPDPVLFADGTVNLGPLKDSMAQDPKPESTEGHRWTA